MTDRQVAALRYMIFNAQNGTDGMKKILSLLIDKSEGFEKEVFTTLTESEEFTGDEIHEDAASMAAMQSSNCTTHLNQLFLLMDTDFQFSVHYGHMAQGGEFDTTGQFPGSPDHPTHTGDEPVRYMFWLARTPYSTSANRVSISRQEIDHVDLSKPGREEKDIASY